MSVVAVAAELALILGLALGSGIAYHMLAYGNAGPIRTFAAVGGLTGLLYVLPFLSQGDHEVATFLSPKRNVSRVLLRWHGALLLLGIVGFLTKTTAIFSRGGMVLFYLCGLVGLLLLNAAMIRFVRTGIEQGRLAPRRLMLVGTAEDIAAFWRRRGTSRANERFVSVTRIPSTKDADAAALVQSLEASLEHARLFNVDSVLILQGSLDEARVESAINVYAALPVSIHLDAGAAFDKIQPTEIERIGNVAALTLAQRPLGPMQALAKRTFDIVAALAGLILLSPFFLIIAALIKLDSKGPVLFLQNRRGYNHRVFKIVKFRSMTTMDNGDHVEQAKAGDWRITRLGAIMRKLNIDELPQLWNVLRGEMSIVGPRPHAVAHDKAFEKRIGDYPRRLNVKPGITGWAQVNGLRGETDTDEKMAQRVKHDLYYIDHWSIWLDFYIVALTVLSRRAFSNAR
ncbi:MAG: exopolysaccharide biosynthesis polyprenyl glycosylphosphotransferase [Hyphomicrobiaceae bacterium]